MIILALFAFLAGYWLQTNFRPRSSGFLSGFFIGCALGLVWTPCAGPILAAVTTLVATQRITWKVIAIAVAYSLGSVFPLFFIAYGSQRALKIPAIAKHAEKIRLT